MTGPYLPLTALDCDSNNDGQVTMFETLQAARCAVGLSPYDRKFDLNFKGTVNMLDVLQIAKYATASLNLEQIRKDILTGERVMLTWPDGWTAPLRALTPDAGKLQRFTGADPVFGVTAYGWIHGVNHPYWAGPYPDHYYVCSEFSGDMARAALATW